LITYLGDRMFESNSKIKSGENFYFVDDLYDWNDYFRDYFISYQHFTQEFTSLNENYIEQIIDVTNNVEELHEYLNL